MSGGGVALWMKKWVKPIFILNKLTLLPKEIISNHKWLCMRLMMIVYMREFGGKVYDTEISPTIQQMTGMVEIICR